jgi:hypothetical protein
MGQLDVWRDRALLGITGDFRQFLKRILSINKYE